MILIDGVDFMPFGKTQNLENFVTENKPISFLKKQQNQACLVYTRFIQIINITIQHTCISLAMVNTLDTLCQVNNQHSVASYC